MMKRNNKKEKKVFNKNININNKESSSNMAKIKMIIFGILGSLSENNIRKYKIRKDETLISENDQVRQDYVWTRTCTLFFFDRLKEKRED